MTEVSVQAYDFGNRHADKAVSLVTGFAGNIDDFRIASIDLADAGYRGTAYLYSDEILTAGNVEALMDVVDRVSADFFDNHGQRPIHRHTGASMGGGIAYNLQRRSEKEGIQTEPGIFAAAGANVPNLIMNNRTFRAVGRLGLGTDIKEVFIANGHSEESLQAAWEYLHEPPSSFVLVLGALDYIVRHREMMSTLAAYREAGANVKKIVLPIKSHTGTIKWFTQHMPELLELAVHPMSAMINGR